MNKKLINVVKGDINTAIQNGNYTRNTDTQTNIEFNTPTKQILLDGVPYSNSPLTKVTWQELKDLRDNSKLIPGNFYRITDYQCTTSQTDTRSAGHQFDIVLLALSENKLAEEGWAMEHPADIYDVTFNDGVTKKCYIWITPNVDYSYLVIDIETHLGAEIDIDRLTIDENEKVATCFRESNRLQDPCPLNYFGRCNLAAWKVWYCLDNDKSRFAWAYDNPQNPDTIVFDMEPEYRSEEERLRVAHRMPEFDFTFNGIKRYVWKGDGDLIATLREYPIHGDLVELVKMKEQVDAVTKFGYIRNYLPVSGKGVIYRLIDEFNNDCPYDFKNILQRSTLTETGSYDGRYSVYLYTFCADFNKPCDVSVMCYNTRNITCFNNKIDRFYTNIANIANESLNYKRIMFIDNPNSTCSINNVYIEGGTEIVISGVRFPYIRNYQIYDSGGFMCLGSDAFDPVEMDNIIQRGYTMTGRIDSVSRTKVVDDTVDLWRLSDIIT